MPSLTEKIIKLPRELFACSIPSNPQLARLLQNVVKIYSMKIKIFSLSIFLVGAGLISKAQSGVYLKGGLNLANVSVTDNGRVDKANQLTSFQVGIVGNVKLGTSLLYLQPGLVYTGKGSKVERGTQGKPGYFNQTFNPMYVELPVNIVFKTPNTKSGRLFVGAGPYIAAGVSGKIKTQGTNLLGGNYGPLEKNIEFSNDDPTTLNQEEGAGLYRVKRFDYGINGTAGLEGKNIVIGLNYGLGLAKLQSGTNSNADNDDKNRVLSLFIGFKF